MSKRMTVKELNEKVERLEAKFDEFKGEAEAQSLEQSNVSVKTLTARLNTQASTIGLLKEQIEAIDNRPWWKFLWRAKKDRNQ